MPVSDNAYVNAFGSDPLFAATKSGFLENFTKHIRSWTHESHADGGYVSASFTCSGNIDWCDGWYADGLGRHIVLKDNNLNVLWEGYVNRVIYNYAEQAMVVGPLTNVANRIKLLFTPYVDVSVSPPISGSVQETIYSENIDSQNLWGIREAVISAGSLITPSTIGGGGADEPTQVREAYLEYMSFPEQSQEIQYGGSVEAGIILECVGYNSMFDEYTHTDNDTGYQTFTAKVLSILASDPNSIFSLDYSKIETNALLTVQKDRNRTATEILVEIASKGDVNYDRWVYGVGSNRIVYYRIVPSRYIYSYRRGRIYDIRTGLAVHPWEVVPGNWIFYSDMAYKQSKTASADGLVDEQSPLYGFIESISFTSPYNVQLTGRRVSTIGQLLSQKGIGL